MRLPVSFDDVWYFRKEYRGDLVVTDGVLYYFPHTNATLEKARRNAPDPADGVAPFLGAAGGRRLGRQALPRSGVSLYEARGAAVRHSRERLKK